MTTIRLPSILVAALSAALAGCSTLSLTSATGLFEEKPKKPARVTAVWTTGTAGNNPVTRGFAGRLLFYAEDGTKPVKVDGTLVVYAFDEEGRKPENVKPDRKFVFTPEQLATHYEKSPLGHAYLVWLPWDVDGGPRKEVSLIVRFLPTGGGMAMSEQGRQYLPGPVSEELSKPSPATTDRSIRQVSYETTDDSRGSAKLSTTTIAVPRDVSLGQPNERAGAEKGAKSAAGSNAAPASSASDGTKTETPSAGRPLGRTRTVGEPIAPVTRGRVPVRPRSFPARAASGNASVEDARTTGQSAISGAAPAPAGQLDGG